MRRFAQLLAVVCALSACGGSGSPHAQSDKRLPLVDAAVPQTVLDHDGDGLCDSTEESFGTDPNVRDTDGDGLPDLIELANGFDPLNRDDPGPDQLAYLQAVLGASTDFMVRATFDGNGQGVAGYFEATESIYTDHSTAQDFYRGTTAVSADPVDSVRSIESESARFAAVLGHARLGFSLRFAYTTVSPKIDCARAYPFRYSLKSDSGDVQGDRLYLLLVATNLAGGAASLNYCMPAVCQ
jgi:hypothetical protein